jgi:hypothetical protein
MSHVNQTALRTMQKEWLRDTFGITMYEYENHAMPNAKREEIKVAWTRYLRARTESERELLNGKLITREPGAWHPDAAHPA